MREENFLCVLPYPEFIYSWYGFFITFLGGKMDNFLNKKMSKTISKKKVNVRHITATGILSAVAFVLMVLEIPVFFMPFFIKFDFSDFPALIGAFALGPIYGVLIEFIKNLLHVLMSGSFGVGEISNFLLGAVFTGVAGFIYQRSMTKKGAMIGVAAGSIAMAIMSYPFNLFIVYPIYYQFMDKALILKAYNDILPFVHSIEASLLIFNVPFTLLKGIADSILTFVLYKSVSPLIKGKYNR